MRVMPDNIEDYNQLLIDNNRDYMLEELPALIVNISEGITEEFFSQTESSLPKVNHERQPLFIVYPGDVGDPYKEAKKLFEKKFSLEKNPFDVQWLEIGIEEDNENNHKNLKNEDQEYKAHFTKEHLIENLFQFRFKHLVFLISMGQPYHEGKQLEATVNLFVNAIRSCVDGVKKSQLLKQKNKSIHNNINERLQKDDGIWHITILVADTLQRHNEAINEKQKEALRESYADKGKEWEKRNKHIFKRLEEAAGEYIPKPIIKFVFWDKFLVKEKHKYTYQEAHDFLGKIYKETEHSNNAYAFYYVIYLRGLEHRSRQLRKKVKHGLNHSEEKAEKYCTQKDCHLNFQPQDRSLYFALEQEVETIINKVSDLKKELKNPNHNFPNRSDELNKLVQRLYEVEKLLNSNEKLNEELEKYSLELFKSGLKSKLHLLKNEIDHKLKHVDEETECTEKNCKVTVSPYAKCILVECKQHIEKIIEKQQLISSINSKTSTNIMELVDQIKQVEQKLQEVQYKNDAQKLKDRNQLVAFSNMEKSNDARYQHKQLQLLNFYRLKYKMFNVPHFVEEQNVCRAPLLHKISQYFNNTIDSTFDQLKIVVCHGMWGVGKTHLVIDYVIQNIPSYTLCVWIDASTDTSIKISLRNLGLKLLLFNKDIKIEDALRIVKDYLEKNPGWLLVFDGVCEGEIVKKYIPLGGHVIITTQKNIQGSLSFKNLYMLEVDVMNQDEAIDLLQRYIDKKSVNYHQFMEIAKRLNYLPAAIQAAGEYLKVRNIYSVKQTDEEKINDFLKECQEDFSEILSIILRIRKKANSLTTFYHLGDSRNNKVKTKLSSILLTICAHLPLNNFPQYIIECWLREAYPNEVKEEPKLCELLINQLVDSHIITLDAKTKLLSMPGFSQSVIQCQIKKSGDIFKTYFENAANKTSKCNPLTIKSSNDSVHENVKLYQTNILQYKEYIDNEVYDGHEAYSLLVMAEIILAHCGYNVDYNDRKMFELCLERIFMHLIDYLSQFHFPYKVFFGELDIRSVPPETKQYGPSINLVNNLLLRIVCKLVKQNNGVTFKNETIVIALNIISIHSSKENLFNRILLLTLVGKAYGQIGYNGKKNIIKNYEFGNLEKALRTLNFYELKDQDELMSSLLEPDHNDTMLGNTFNEDDLIENVIRRLTTQWSSADNLPWITVLLKLCYVNPDKNRSKKLLERLMDVVKLYSGNEHILLIRDAMHILRMLESNDIKGNITEIPIRLEHAQRERELLEQALIREKVYIGRKYKYSATTLYKLARCYLELGDVCQANQFAECSYFIHCRDGYLAYPEDHEYAEQVKNFRINRIYAELSRFRNKPDYLQLIFIWFKRELWSVKEVHKVLAVLQYYTVNNNRFNRLICWHWGRNHISEVERIFNAVIAVKQSGKSIDDLSDVITNWIIKSLRRIKLKNSEGVLATIINFLGVNKKNVLFEEINETNSLSKYTFEELEYLGFDWKKINIQPEKLICPLTEKFICPLTKNLMIFPVQDEFGDHYEKVALNSVRLKNNNVSPLNNRSYTNKPNEEFPLNYTLALEIEIFKFELSSLWNDFINKKIERELALTEPKINSLLTDDLRLDTERHQEIEERTNSNNLSRR